jgi:endonuclease/exonuclease/phosphatase family metal-dependent hydrolase
MNPIAPTEVPMRKLREVFSDTFQEADKEGLREGPIGTYNGFNPDANMESQGKRGDYIFAKGDYDLKRFKVIDTKFSGQYPSDHLPVTITVTF